VKPLRAGLVAFLLGLLFGGILPGVGSGAVISEVRHWSAPDHTRVVIDLDRLPAHEMQPSDDPLILRLHLSSCEFPKGRREVAVNDRIIRLMKIEPDGKGNVGIIVSLVKPSRWNLFTLRPYQNKPHRLVIDVFRPDLEEKEKADRRGTQALRTKQHRIVVIDPGHGGEDPGAVGTRGTLEKDVAMAIAQMLQKELDRVPGIRAFLTRRGDYFVSLDDRGRIAREYGADLFVSLHANGNRNPKVRGSSVYCLSLKGASDQAAQLLAQKENASDLIGGARGTIETGDLGSILLDLEQTHTINESLHLAGLALSSLKRVNRVQFPQPKQADFRVLKAWGIPSILVEMAYITNPVEERLLQRRNFHSEMARALSEAIRKFIPHLARREEGEGPGTKRGLGEAVPKRVAPGG
jgi:N-acetylmuramoyl-L-alanine amidase